jgi:hypothetical protein
MVITALRDIAQWLTSLLPGGKFSSSNLLEDRKIYLRACKDFCAGVCS